MEPPRVGTRAEGVLSLVGEQGKLYLHLKEWFGKLDEMMTAMTREYEGGGGGGGPADLRPGARVAVKYREDECWYRGRVEDVSPSGTASVFFVDYGNVESVGPERVRALSPRFAQLPPLLLPCRLYGLKKAADWSPADSQVLLNYLTAKAQHGGVFAVSVAALGPGNVYEVELSPKGSPQEGLCNKEIAAAMMQGQSSGRASGGAAALPLGASAASPSLDVRRDSGERPLEQLSPTPPDALLGKGLQDVRLSFVKGSGEFYLTLQRGLAELQGGLNDFYQSERAHRYRIPSSRLLRGTVCAAQFEGEWYRALIVGTGPGPTLTLFYSDFGNTESGLSTADVRFLKDEFNSPVLGLRCAARGVPASEDQPVCAFLEGFLEETPLKAVFHSFDLDTATYDVELLNLSPAKDQEVVLNSALLTIMGKGGSSSSGPTEAGPGEVEEWEVGAAKGSVFFVRGLPPLRLPAEAGGWLSALVSHAESPAKIFVQLPEQTKAILAVQERLQRWMGGEGGRSIGRGKWREGQLCAARFSDGAWYRGLVRRSQGGLCDVYMLDYGNTEVGLAAGSLGRLEGRGPLRETAPQAFPVCCDDVLRRLPAPSPAGLARALTDATLHLRLADAPSTRLPDAVLPASRTLVSPPGHPPSAMPLPIHQCLP